MRYLVDKLLYRKYPNISFACTPEDEESQEEESSSEEEESDEEIPEAVVVNERDPKTDAMAVIWAAVQTSATDEEKDQLRDLIGANKALVKDILKLWAHSDDPSLVQKAQLSLGYMQLKGWLKTEGPSSLNRNDDTSPPGAPTTINALLNSNQRHKVARLASTVHQKHSVDFHCRPEWPKYDGYYVNINEVAPNTSGTNHKDPSKKKRSITQVTVLSGTEGGIARFEEVFQIRDGYDYQTTVDPDAFTERLKEA